MVKKGIFLLLILIMALSLCACGDNADLDNPMPDASPEISEPAPIEEVPTEKIFYLNKTETIGDYEFTVTGTEFTHTLTLSDGNYSAGDGEVYLILYYSIKNVGKSEVSPDLVCVVEYADGYTFEESSYLLPIAPLSEASNEFIAIEVPEVIEEDYTSDLKIVIKGSTFGVEDDYNYYLNPMDETQKEAVYNKATFFVENGFYNEALDYFTRCGDYRDSADMVSAVAEYIDIIKKPGEYKDKLSEYRTVSGEEISPLLLGNDFMMSKTGEYWTFSENNVLYDTYCNENPLMNQYASWGYGNFQPTWHVQDDKLVVTGLNGDGKEVETAFTIYEVGNGIFLLYTDSTEMLVGDLMYGDGTGVYSLYKKSAVEDRFLIP